MLEINVLVREAQELLDLAMVVLCTNMLNNSMHSDEGCKVVVEESNVPGNGDDDLNVTFGALVQARMGSARGGRKDKGVEDLASKLVAIVVMSKWMTPCAACF